MYLNSGSLLGLKMAKKIAETCRHVKQLNIVTFYDICYVY